MNPNHNFLSIYIHIPFCHKKCPYCDFFVLANTAKQQHQDYVNYILKEIELYSDLSLPKNPEIKSIYFGGGTPSLIEAELIQKIISRLGQKFSLKLNDIEISLEANPEDVTPQKVQLWKDCGVNRVTLGIQSLIDSELEFLGRQHQKNTALNAIDILNEGTIDNIGVDLMYQLPDQNLQNFKKNLDLLFERSFKHLSLYGLTVEPKTPFAKQVKSMQWLPLAEDSCEKLFLLAQNYLSKKQFEQYEISNFCLENYKSKHNQCYWQQQAYWGLGVSSHSYAPAIEAKGIPSKRWWNPKNLKQYCTSIDQKKYPHDQEILTPEQDCMEYVYTHLRTEGLKASYLENFITSSSKKNAWQNLIKNLESSHYIKYLTETLTLTQQGQIRSDWICQEMLHILL